MRILVTDGMDKSAIAALRAGGHEVVEQFYAPEELGKALRDFDCCVVRSKTKVRANHIDEAKGGNLKLIISLNYFGAVRLAEGVFDLLKKRRGACVVVASNTISQGAARMDVVNLLNNQMDEPRVLALMEKLDPKKDAHSMYVATKYALARWMRRVSADWAAQGVRMNAIAPGNVETAMTAKLSPYERVAVLALPIPTLYGQEKLMDPEDIAKSIVFLASSMASGVNGVILFCDGGTDALLNTEKVY